MNTPKQEQAGERTQGKTPIHVRKGETLHQAIARLSTEKNAKMTELQTRISELEISVADMETERNKVAAERDALRDSLSSMNEYHANFEIRAERDELLESRNKLLELRERDAKEYDKAINWMVNDEIELNRRAERDALREQRDAYESNVVELLGQRNRAEALLATMLAACKLAARELKAMHSYHHPTCEGGCPFNEANEACRNAIAAAESEVAK